MRSKPTEATSCLLSPHLPTKSLKKELRELNKEGGGGAVALIAQLLDGYQFQVGKSVGLSSEEGKVEECDSSMK